MTNGNKDNRSDPVPCMANHWPLCATRVNPASPFRLSLRISLFSEALRPASAIFDTNLLAAQGNADFNICSDVVDRMVAQTSDDCLSISWANQPTAGHAYVEVVPISTLGRYYISGISAFSAFF